MKKIDWCLEKGEIPGRKHRGLRRKEPDAEESMSFLRKAEHNLEFAEDVKRMGKYDDWVFPATFYAMYHACLAVLAYFGFESRNQECTFAALDAMTDEGKIILTSEDMRALRQAGERSDEPGIRTLREDFQYGTKTKADKELVDGATKTAKDFVEKVKGVLYLMYGEI